MTDEQAITTHVEVTRLQGPNSEISLPVGNESFRTGLHGGVREHYGVSEDNFGFGEVSTTLDYLVASAAGCLTGTFGGALDSLGVPADDDRLTASAVGSFANDGRVLVLANIHIKYRLRVDSAPDVEAINRAFESHPKYCPVYRSLTPHIPISTELELLPPDND